MKQSHRPRNARGYRRRIILSIGVFYALSFTAAALLGWKYASVALYESLSQHLLESAKTTAMAIDMYMDRMQSIARSYARVIERTVPADEKITPAMLSAFREEAGLADLYFGSASGLLITDLNWQPPPLYDPRLRPWYNAALLSDHDPVYSGVYLDLIYNQLAISYGAQVRYPDGRLRGVLAVDIMLNTLNESFAPDNAGATGYVFLADQSGAFLIHPDERLRGQQFRDFPEGQIMFAAMMEGKQTIIDFRDRGGTLALSTRLPKSGWTLGLVTDKKTALRPLYTLGWFFTLMLAASLTLVVLVSRNLAKKIGSFAEQLERELGVKNAELEVKVAEIERISVTDPLTGIANRRKIENDIADEISRVQRTAKPCALIMFDVDHFKDINDRFGHETGDAVLCKLTELTAGAIRQTDCFGRWGGEEFLVLCPETTLEGTAQLAEKLRAGIQEGLVFPDFSVTCTFGISICRADDSAGRLVCRADTAMYRAKRDGRNRIATEQTDV